MRAVDKKWGSGVNAEAIEAWDGPLYDRFVRFRHVVTAGLGAHGEEAGVPNARFDVVDVQATPLRERFDMAFSRMGTMFFSSPVAAMRNVRKALVPGGRLAMVVWRQRIDNDWLYRAQTIVERIVDRPEAHDEPTCGPGPFSMANADTTSDVLRHAGFGDIALHRCDIPILIGRDIEEAVDMVMSIGPAGEILRLAGPSANHLKGQVHEALRDGLSEYAGKDGVRAPASTWVVTASA